MDQSLGGRWRDEKHRTTAFSKFLHAWAELVSFETFVLRVTHDAAITSEMLRVLSSTGGTQDSSVDSPISRSFSPLQELQMSQEMMAQLIVCRSVDDFLTYLSDLLVLIFKTRPEMLKSQESVTVADVLEHHTMGDFIAAITERKVNALSYKGIHDLDLYLVKHFGFPICQNEAAIQQITTVVEVRNIITHNQGIVNTLFSTRVPAYAEHVGKLLTMASSDTLKWMRFLKACAEDLDSRAEEKFSLPTSSPSFYRPYVETIPGPTL
jgi:hypothetical protein